MTANTHANIISSSFSFGTVFVDGIFISISVYLYSISLLLYHISINML